MLERLISEMPLFQQPVMNLEENWTRLYRMKEEIKVNIQDEQPLDAHSWFLAHNSEEVPLTLLVSILRYLKSSHQGGQGLQQVEGPVFDFTFPDLQGEPNDELVLRQIQDTLSLVHMMKLKGLEEQVIHSQVLLKYLGASTAIFMTQFSAVHLMMCFALQKRYDEMIN